LNINHDKNQSLELFIEAIESYNEDQKIIPILCFDEFEHLTKRKIEFTDSVFEAWRSMGNSSKVVFITASKVTLDELIQQGSLTSQFHNIFTLMPLNEFTKEGAQTFLSIGRKCDRPFTEEEIEKIQDLAGCHPAKLQVICSLLYEAKSNPKYDWQNLETEYQKQIEFIFGKAPQTHFSFPQWLKNTLRVIFVLIPRTIGRFLLDIFNRDKAQDSTALLVGWGVVILITAILIGWLNPQKTIELMKNIWLFFFPPKS
jgi:uncharacterized protein